MTERPIVDFDHHSTEFHEDRVAGWAELRECPVAFNERYGGFWVVSGHDVVDQVSRDGETFSSKHQREPGDDGISYLGIAGIPRGRSIPTAGIAEVEGPTHVALRRVMNRYLTPTAIGAMRPRMEASARWFLDQVIERGRLDLVDDFTNPVPAVLTMDLVGLPLDDWHLYAEFFHGTIAHRPGSPEFDRAIGNVGAMLTRLGEEAAARRQAPTDDLLSDLVTMEVDGRRLDDDEIRSVLWNLVGGGLDTTTSLTSLSLLHLAQHPEQRQDLIDHPELLAGATEEFLRFFSVNETLTRTITADTTLGGQELCRGEHLMLSWLSANRDERVFERPDEVVLDRAPNPHLAFGVGAHRCIGMHMARTMFQVLITEVLTRIPDYEIDADGVQLYAGNPELNGVVHLPATFTPGPRLGPAERPF
ncbi:cytochrome P450 [Aquihabitans sp. McL0605]|uniref:cytochrome P450 n=1 Tax=Aquihabitans sp. McL0605 TaxID=3415671 RepID=UPI003CF2BD7B